jgi:phosphoglucosamine mutase
MVKETGANAGVAYDGDADRMAVVDENGVIVPMDRLIAAYAAQLVSKGRGKTIVVPVDASMCIEESVEAVGGRVVRTAVGDVNVAEAVTRHKAALGAEASGAWINPDYNLCPDGILSSLLLIASVSGGPSESLSEFVKGVPQHPILRGSIACPEKLKAEVMNLLQLELPKFMQEKNEILSIDGIRVSSQEAWILVRESGTEPLLRATVEAKDYKRAELLMSEVTLLIQSIIKRLST